MIKIVIMIPIMRPHRSVYAHSNLAHSDSYEFKFISPNNLRERIQMRADSNELRVMQIKKRMKLLRLIWLVVTSNASE